MTQPTADARPAPGTVPGRSAPALPGHADVLRAFGRTRVLVVDPVRDARRLMRGALSELGFGEVLEAGGALEAMRKLADGPCGLVVCEDTLAVDASDATTGQQLLEHARETGRLPAWAMFVLCTAEAARERVAAALECPPDGYLLKPFTADRLESLMQRLFERRLVFDAVHRSLARKDFTAAVEACRRIAAAHPTWAIEAMRLQAQSLLDLGRPGDADAVCAAALEARGDLGWARVGRARALFAAGKVEEACAHARAAIDGGATLPAAFDVLARAAEARDDPEALLEVTRRACSAIPSARRRRQHAHAAYRAGEVEIARTEFDRVVRTTRSSVAAQSADTTHLAQIHVDTGDAPRAIAVIAADDRGARRATPRSAAVALARLAVVAQAHAANGNADAARRALDDAKAAHERLAAECGSTVGAGVEAARLHLARAHLALGETEQGLEIVARAIRGDHESRALAGLARRMMAGTGHEDTVDRLIDEISRGMGAAIDAADALMREARYEESLETLRAALADVPDNVALLVAATRLHLLYLRQRGLERDCVERVRGYLGRLDVLAPDADSVTTLHRFFRDTLNRTQPAAA
jgi:CheY-like chemotaxis protein